MVFPFCLKKASTSFVNRHCAQPDGLYQETLFSVLYSGNKKNLSRSTALRWNIVLGVDLEIAALGTHLSQRYTCGAMRSHDPESSGKTL